MQDTKPDKKTREAKAIAGAVRAVMARRGMRQNDLRPMLDWSKSYFDRRFGADVEMSLKDLMEIGAVLDCAPESLISMAVEDLQREAVAA